MSIRLERDSRMRQSTRLESATRKYAHGGTRTLGAGTLPFGSAKRRGLERQRLRLHPHHMVHGHGPLLRLRASESPAGVLLLLRSGAWLCSGGGIGLWRRDGGVRCGVQPRAAVGQLPLSFGRVGGGGCVVFICARAELARVAL